jgi:hypothetical protein
MQKVRVLLLLLGLCWFSGQSVLLYAQEEGQEEEEGGSPDGGDGGIGLETDWDGYIAELYSQGDQTFTVSLGVIFPAVFHDDTPEKITHNWFPVGGAGTLAYTYFLNSHLFMGIEIGINFNRTLAKNTIFIIPVGARVGWQFILYRFEFPISFSIGVAPERYLNYGYTGMFLKLGASAFFRFSPEWSFGLNTDWNWYPQWPRQNESLVPVKSMYANIVGLTLAARYHF